MCVCDTRIHMHTVKGCNSRLYLHSEVLLMVTREASQVDDCEPQPKLWFSEESMRNPKWGHLSRYLSCICEDSCWLLWRCLPHEVLIEASME